MKRIIILISILVTFFGSTSFSQEIEAMVAKLVERSYDLAYSGLYEESKIELIAGLYCWVIQ